MARTIQSPGVEIKEIDQSIRPVIPAGTNVLVTGFADRGPTDEVIQVTSRTEFLEIYGSPTVPAELYLSSTTNALFNSPASDEIEKSNLLNCSYVLEISSQGVSDELTSERDFKTFKGFPVNVELNQKNSKIKFLNGLLYEKSKDYLAINIKGKIKKIPFDEVLKISLCTLKD